jgi:hypothetical protein
VTITRAKFSTCWFSARRDKRAALRLMRKLLRKQGFVPKLLTTDKLGSRPSQPPSDVKLLRPQLPPDRDCQVDATDDRRGFDTEVPISCRHTMVCRQHHQGVRDRHVVAVAGSPRR